jgi:sarcosine oxidase subunit delta
MRIACPFCGERESGEFTYLGDASPKRPNFAADSVAGPEPAEDAFYDYAYLRENVAGVMREYWYHGGGCRSWLVAERNTVTHEFGSVTAASGAATKLAQAGE